MAGVNFMVTLLTQESLGQESRSMIICHEIYNDGRPLYATSLMYRVSTVVTHHALISIVPLFLP